MLIPLYITMTMKIILTMYKVLYNSLFLLLLVAALVTVLGGIRHLGRLGDCAFGWPQTHISKREIYFPTVFFFFKLLVRNRGKVSSN
jgi:hypothetical protein